ncbi:MAG: hypothetical protein LBK00_10595 [Treponema sp.]|jgi:hypothetical protein|nr:hypothetical protein [Treponema sp.]
MKKMFIGLIFILLTTFNGFALSFGGGWVYEMGFSSVTVKAPNGAYHDRASTTGRGFFFFLDMTYLEATLGFPSFSLEPDGNPHSYDYALDGYDWKSMTLGLYGKIPIELDYDWTLFPMFGFDIQFFQEESVGGNTFYRDDLSYSGLPDDYYDDVWFRAGLGLDFYIDGWLLLRGEFLWGIKFNNQYEKDYISWLGNGADGYFKGNPSADLFTHGPQFRLSAGIHF